jgi:hypothetical protein
MSPSTQSVFSNSKIENTVRYLDIDVEDALVLAETINPHSEWLC